MSDPAPTSPPDLSRYGLTPWPVPAGPLVPVGQYVTQAYRTEPGRPLPSPVPDFSDWELVVAGPGAGTRGYALYRSPRVNPAPGPLPAAPAPANPAPPVLPAVTRIVIPPDKRAFGLNQFNHIADQAYADQQYEGAEQNSAINFQGKATFRNYRAIGSYSAQWNYGNGLYLSGIKGGATIDGALLAFNGRPEDQPQFTPGMHAHGLYYQADNGPLTGIVGIIAINNAAAGVQTRTDAEYELFSFGNSTPILHIMGRLKVRKATIVAPALHHDGTNWAGGAAVYAVYPVQLADTWIVGVDGQQRPVTGKVGGVFPAAAVTTGGTWSNDDHPVWTPPDPSIPLVTASGCVLSGKWAGGLFGGAKPHDGSGFTLAPNNVPASLGTQVLAVYRQVVVNSLSISDALASLHKLTRGAAADVNPQLAPLLK